MKNKILLLLAVAGLAISAPAQTLTTNETTAVQSTQTFFTSAENYFTEINTNFTWTNVTLEASTGYKQVTGVNAASVVDVQYDLGNWGAGISAQFSGVGSPINALQASGSYALISRYDTKLEGYIRVGYDWNVKGGVAEPGILIKKKLTANTFADIGISLPVYTVGKLNRNPTLEIATGFTY